MKIYNPILITGVERSGATLIARILDICGVESGNIDKMYENKEVKSLCKEYLRNTDKIMPDTDSLNIPVNWAKRLPIETDKQWMVKSSMLSRMWPVWNYAYPDARWIIVRRRTGDIIQSCVKTGFMDLFKDRGNLDLIGVDTEKEGWLWWVHEYEKRFVEMIQAGLNCTIVWPDRMAMGNYQQINETLNWLGLEWDSKIVETIGPILTKRRK